MITTLGEVARQNVWRGKKSRHVLSSAAPLLSEKPLRILSLRILILSPHHCPLLTPCITSPPFLNGFPHLAFTVLCRFLSPLVKCVAEGSSGLCTEALAFHKLPERLCQPHFSPSPCHSSPESPALDLVSSFHVFFFISFLPLRPLEPSLLFPIHFVSSFFLYCPSAPKVLSDRIFPWKHRPH